MFYSDFNLIVRRYISPHWRYTGKEKLIMALCKPISDINDLFRVYRKRTASLVNLNSQVGVLKNHLIKITGATNVVIIDGDFLTYDFIVYVTGSELSVNEIVKEINKYKIAGKRFIVETY